MVNAERLCYLGKGTRAYSISGHGPVGVCSTSTSKTALFLSIEGVSYMRKRWNVVKMHLGALTIT